jgi:hypothetical protein
MGRLFLLLWQFLLHSTSVLAVDPPYPPCGVLPGCEAMSNVLNDTAIPSIAKFMVRLAGGLGVIFVMIGGGITMLNWGDESKISRGKWAVIYALLGLGLAVISQLLVGYIVTEDYGQGAPTNLIFANVLPSVVDIMLTVLNSVFAVVIIIAGVRMARTEGKPDEYNRAQTMVVYACAGAVLVNLSYTLVLVALDFFGG